MSNKQQIIYIKHIRALVSPAIQKATATIGKGAERPAHNMGIYAGCLMQDRTPELFPDHYTAGLVHIPALEPFDDVLAILDSDMETLSKPKEKSQ